MCSKLNYIVFMIFLFYYIFNRDLATLILASIFLQMAIYNKEK